MILWNFITFVLIVMAAIWLERKGWPRPFFSPNPVFVLVAWLVLSLALHIIG